MISFNRSIRVTNNDFSITSPTTSPFYWSPILNKRIYVSIKPGNIFESDPADPNVNRKPEKQKRLEIQENHLEDRKITTTIKANTIT
jgi:hypothetical protein